MDAMPQPDDAAMPELACSLIMKGGITSGVVYPRLVTELAQTYRFADIGGTSAGAIAAAAAAIAEYRRQRDHSDAGFQMLSRLPDELTKPVGKRSVLLSLFQPQPKTAALFDTMVALVDAPQPRSSLARVVDAARAWFGSYPIPTLLGALPGLALATWGVLAGGAAMGIGLIGGLILAVIGAVVGAVVGAWRTLSHQVPDNLFGLCSGRGGSEAAPALTDWLHNYFQELAGRGPEDAPVTFADLASQGINLRVMTTNLSQRRPMAMPWAEAGFFFRRSDWQELFPPQVVEWMSRPEHAPDGPKGGVRAREFRERVEAAAQQGLVPLPYGDLLPVVVAVRMSLSFPLLISAVPMASTEWSTDSVEFVTNWFSDGGLCANLPVHFFDRPIPGNPTFAIDMEQVDWTITSVEEGSFLPKDNQDGLSRELLTWEAGAKDGVGQLVSAILSTWQSWVDGEALRLPGYRDRVVTVYTTANEGGLNLTMPPETVTALADRGQVAGAKLVDKFAPKPGSDALTGFDNHRWLRLRAALAGLGEWLDEFAETFDQPGDGALPYPELVKLTAAELPSYHRSLRTVRSMVAELNDLVDAVDVDALSVGAPRPRAKLRLTPYDRSAADRTPDEVQVADLPEPSPVL
jgi:predicted acylesterase/phospholipase RssA